MGILRKGIEHPVGCPVTLSTPEVLQR